MFDLIPMGIMLFPIVFAGYCLWKITSSISSISNTLEKISDKMETK